MYSMRSVDGKSWPFLRDGDTVGALFRDEEIRNLVKKVDIIPGHVAISFKRFNHVRGSSLCIFDAVPPSSTISSTLKSTKTSLTEEEDRIKLVQFLKSTSGTSINGLSGSSPTSTFLSSSPDSLLIPIIEGTNTEFSGFPHSSILYNGGSDIISVYFERKSKQRLRLFAVASSGKMLVWEWWDDSLERYLKSSGSANVNISSSGAESASSWKWHLICNNANVLYKSPSISYGTNTQKPVQERPIIRAASLSGQYNTLMWWETDNKLFYRKAVETNFDARRRGKKPLEMEFGIVRSVEAVPNMRDFAAGKDGIWMTTAVSVHFWSFRSQAMHVLELADPTSEISVTSGSSPWPPVLRNLFATAVHPITQELVVLEPGGNVFVCTSDAEGKVKATFLCALQHFPSEASNIKFTFYYNTLVCFAEHFCWFFYAKSGLLLLKEPTSATPEKIILTDASLGGQSCFCDAEGMWEIVGSSIAQQASSIAHHKNGKSETENLSAAAEACGDWGLDRWKSKYLLDAIIAADPSDDITKIKGLELLLPHLQNPLLLLPLLSDATSRRYVILRFRQFLLTYDVNQFARYASEDELAKYSSQDRSAARTAYYYHTSLNKTLAPLIAKYLDIALLREADCDAQHLDKNEDAAAQKVVHQTRGEIELLASTQPVELLRSLEDNFLRSENEETSSLLLNQEESLADFALKGTRTPRHPFFDIMCRLYFRLKPDLLVPFILSVVEKTRNNQRSESRLRRSLFERAIGLLSPADETNCVVYAQLLQEVGLLSTSAEILLNFARWDEAVLLLKQISAEAKPVEHAEIFYLLLRDCLARRRYARVSSLWPVAPANFGALHLFRMLQLYQPKDEPTNSILTDDGRATAKRTGRG
eukprot:TRINITY_DN3672_c0_g1_i2.p1 TRINITY_DN3672_c0_g1~~TRINITY_DN3672_c0_g1_i2.p1  ORF type:complete len:875 (+),score=188.45 TRINITY_DN3672_c0_g1_i2:106-2730(+)